MNHPPNKKKKQHDNPLLPEDGQIDERNLIDLEDAEEISFEDRVSMYWMENKGFIIGCISILVVVVVAYQGMRMYKDSVEQQLQADYAAAQASETLADFATEHSSKELGGFAALLTADEAYTAKDFSKALEFYTVAADVFSEPTLKGRAQLGQAFANYASGNTSEGLAQLNAITADAGLAEAVRAEAAYHLAVEADAEGNSAEFDSYAAQISEFTLAGQWQQRLSYYEQQR